MPSTLDSPRRQTVMQYSVRGMLLVTLAIGLLCALVVPLMKWLNISATALVCSLGAATTGAMFTIALRSAMRYKLEEKCGPLLAIVPSRTEQGRRWEIIFGIIGGFAWIIFAMASAGPRTPDFMQSFLGGCILGLAALEIRSKGAVRGCELCENGIVIPSKVSVLPYMRFLPWNSFRGYRRATDKTLQLLLQHDFITLHAPADLDGIVVEILDTYISKEAPPPEASLIDHA